MEPRGAQLRPLAASALLSHPGRWLLAALLLNLTHYRLSTVEYGFENGDTFWLMLDLFLFWRVWRGGTRARGVLVFLMLAPLVVNAILMAASNFNDSIIGGMGWPAWACALGSLACLLSRALDPAAQPFSRKDNGAEDAAGLSSVR